MAEQIDPQSLDATTAIFDVRHHRHGEQIRGAVHYDPHAMKQAQQLSLPVAHDGTIVLYGDDEAQASELAERLEDSGFMRVRVLRGGIEAWKAAGLPVEEASQEQPIPEVPDSGIPR